MTARASELHNCHRDRLPRRGPSIFPSRLVIFLLFCDIPCFQTVWTRGIGAIRIASRNYYRTMSDRYVNRRISFRWTLCQARVALKHIALHCSETLLGDQAASDFNVMTKDRAAELGNKSKSMCVYVKDVYVFKSECLPEKTRENLRLIVILNYYIMMINCIF